MSVPLGSDGVVAVDLRWDRDVRGADPVAVGDGRQSLDVGAQHLLERPGLGLAQLRELGRDVRDRAVVLADLDAGARRALGASQRSRAR